MNERGEAPMLAVAGVEVRRGGAVVLDVPRLEVQPGETLAIIGPNGAGKSTLLLAMALLLSPSAGTICVGGEPATPGNALRLRRRMAVVFQEPLLLDATVAENVAAGLKLRGMARGEREVAANIWLERFGIADLAMRPAHSLSGGEAQRASLARALALEPEVLLLDEPFSALDAPTRAALGGDLLAALRETRTATVLVTHDREEALMYGDRVAVLVGGRLRQVDTPEAVFGTPADVEVASFVGVETIASGTVVAQQDGLAQVKIGSTLIEVTSALGPGAPVLLCLRPEEVTLQQRPRSNSETVRSSARNQIPGRVLAVLPWGTQQRVVVDCGFRLTAAVTRRSVGELGLAEGLEVIASFKATSAHLLERGAGATSGAKCGP